MKRFLLISLLLALFANPGWCITITDTDAGSLNGSDVGSLDTWVAETNSLSNSSWETETAWLNNVLGTNYTYAVQEPDTEYYTTDATNSDGIYAFYLGLPETEYFILKNASYWVLFANEVELDWGVFATSQLPDMNIPPGDLDEPFVISHVTRTAPVPEPSTILLLGAGLAGLGFYGRKRGKK